MESNFGINNKIDLYKRVLPALNCKVRELDRQGIKNVKKEDIWNYLLKIKWANAVGLSLGEMVDNILNIDKDELIKFTTSQDNVIEVDDFFDNLELL